jgi:hypothetical protein
MEEIGGVGALWATETTADYGLRTADLKGERGELTHCVFMQLVRSPQSAVRSVLLP